MSNDFIVMEPIKLDIHKPRFSSYIPIGLAILFLGLSIALYVQKEIEMKEKITLKAQLEESRNTQKRLEENLRNLQTSSASLETKMKLSEEQISQLTQKVSQAVLDAKETEEALKEKDNQILELKTKIHTLEKQKEELTVRLEKQYAEYFEMQNHLKMVLKTKEELELRAKELTENGPVSLGSVIVQQVPRQKK